MCCRRVFLLFVFEAIVCEKKKENSEMKGRQSLRRRPKCSKTPLSSITVRAAAAETRGGLTTLVWDRLWREISSFFTCQI